jgi:hypothetical protein
MFEGNSGFVVELRDIAFDSSVHCKESEWKTAEKQSDLMQDIQHLISESAYILSRVCGRSSE